MFKFNPLRKRQRTGAVIGLAVAVIIYVLLPLKRCEGFLSLGPMNKGHEELSCSSCHTSAKGTLVQQINSNIQYALGMRKTLVDFGSENVDNKKCLACHNRPNDRHPVNRFLEPRFQKAVNEINVTQCETCHEEHNGVRVVFDNAVFCVNCHYDLSMLNDPLDVPHEVLIKQEKWSTCLQCHDFHGNHVYKVPEKLIDTISVQQIKAYLKGGADPYSSTKKYMPLSEREWLKSKLR